MADALPPQKRALPRATEGRPRKLVKEDTERVGTWLMRESGEKILTAERSCEYTKDENEAVKVETKAEVPEGQLGKNHSDESVSRRAPVVEVMIMDEDDVEVAASQCEWGENVMKCGDDGEGLCLVRINRANLSGVVEQKIPAFHLVRDNAATIKRKPTYATRLDTRNFALTFAPALLLPSEDRCCIALTLHFKDLTPTPGQKYAFRQSLPVLITSHQESLVSRLST